MVFDSINLMIRTGKFEFEGIPVSSGTLLARNFSNWPFDSKTFTILTYDPLIDYLIPYRLYNPDNLTQLLNEGLLEKVPSYVNVIILIEIVDGPELATVRKCNGVLRHMQRYFSYIYDSTDVQAD